MHSHQLLSKFLSWVVTCEILLHVFYVNILGEGGWRMWRCNLMGFGDPRGKPKIGAFIQNLLLILRNWIQVLWKERQVHHPWAMPLTPLSGYIEPLGPIVHKLGPINYCSIPSWSSGVVNLMQHLTLPWWSQWFRYHAWSFHLVKKKKVSSGFSFYSYLPKSQ